jgi:hypothetical protein
MGRDRSGRGAGMMGMCECPFFLFPSPPFWLRLSRVLIEFRAREREYQMCNLLGLKSFRTVDMRHRTKCFGAVIKHQDDWSVV